jgi:hypothetical protein
MSRFMSKARFELLPLEQHPLSEPHGLCEALAADVPGVLAALLLS